MSNDMETQLETLRLQLIKDEADIGKYSRTRDTTKAKITVLQKKLDEQKASQDAYAKNKASYKTRSEEINNFCKDNLTILAKTLPDALRTKIDDEVKKVDADIDTNQARINNLKRGLPDLQKALGNAKIDYDAAEARYSDFTGYGKTLDSTLKELNAQEKTACEEQNNNVKYFYISDLSGKADPANLKIYSEDEYNAQLKDLLVALHDANEALNESDTALKQSLEEMGEKQKTVDALLKSRNGKIIAAIKDLS